MIQSQSLDPSSGGKVGRVTVVLSANSLWNIQNFRTFLIRRLASFGVRLIVAAPCSDDERAKFDLPADVHPLRVDRSGMNPRLDGSLLLSYHRLFRFIRPAAYLSWTIKPNIYGALAARACGVPAILNVSGLGTGFLRGAIFSRFIGLLYRFAFSRAHVVFFQNHADRDLFLSRRLVRPAQARLVPGSGIDLNRFPLMPPVFEPGAPRFLLIARLLGDKGVREYAAAARSLQQEHPKATFQLLGPLDPENRSAISASELGSWIAEGVIDYLGATEDVRPYIAKATAVVLPSYREGLPRSLLEGAAIGRALVATDVPGCRDVVEDGVNGFLCQARDEASLADAMNRVALMSERELIAMGRVSRKRVESAFGQEQVADAYLLALRELGVLNNGSALGQARITN